MVRILPETISSVVCSSASSVPRCSLFFRSVQFDWSVQRRKTLDDSTSRTRIAQAAARNADGRIAVFHFRIRCFESSTDRAARKSPVKIVKSRAFVRSSVAPTTTFLRSRLSSYSLAQNWLKARLRSFLKSEKIRPFFVSSC